MIYPVPTVAAAVGAGGALLHCHHRTKFVKRKYEFACDFNLSATVTKKLRVGLTLCCADATPAGSRALVMGCEHGYISREFPKPARLRLPSEFRWN
jgi:hypothetical protein